MSSAFRPFLRAGNREPVVISYTPASAEDFLAGALVVYNTSTDVIDECGSDPGSVLGIALADAAAKTLYADGKVPVAVLDPDVVVCLASSTTPVEGHKYDAGYGVVKTGNNWLLDISETSAKVFQVIDVDIANGIFFCRAIASVLQADQIAS